MILLYMLIKDSILYFSMTLFYKLATRLFILYYYSLL